MLPGYCISEELLVAIVITNLFNSPTHAPIVTHLLTKYVNRLPSLSALRYHLEIVHSKPSPPSPSPLAAAADVKPRRVKTHDSSRPLTTRGCGFPGLLGQNLR